MPRTTTRRVLLVLVALFVTLGGTAHAAPPPSPSFPASIDSYAAYQGQTTCASVPTPGAVALQRLVTTAYPQFRKGYLLRPCDIGGTSEHKDGRAWDWPLDASNSAEKAAADELLAWLTAPDEHGNAHARARRLGIMYAIWNGKIYKAYGSSPGWYAYTGANPHTDHVHFSMSWSGARQSTSWWLRTEAATPGIALDGAGLSLALRAASGSTSHRSWTPTAGTTTAVGIGGNVVGGLGSALLADGTLVVAGRGTDDQLWVNRRAPGAGWGGWVPGGGLLSARPAVTADAGGGVHIAVRGADGSTWLTSLDPAGRWTPWEGVGGVALQGSGPGLARTADGRLELVVLGGDAAPWRRTRTGSAWTAWTRVEGRAKGDVGLAAGGAGVVLAVRGPDERAYIGTLGVAGWVGLGGVLSSAPAVAADPTGGRVDVVVVGTDGRLYRSSRSEDRWSSWELL